MQKSILLFITLILTINYCNSQVVYPVAVFHGMGDSCSFAGMKSFVKELQDGLRGTYVRCIESGSFIGSFDHSLTEQSEKACQELNEDPNLQGNISVVGLSQGGLVARSIIEQCKFQGTVKRFVSIAGPHMGVATIPNCFKGLLCNFINKIVRNLVYEPFIQNVFGPANMFNNAKDQDAYIEGNPYLPKLNNQNPEIFDESYKSNMEQLEVLLLTMFEGDTMVNPPSSAWFSFWDAKMKNVIPMEQQEIYTDDLIGLKELNENNIINFLQLPGNHLQFTSSDVQKYFIPALAGLNIPDSDQNNVTVVNEYSRGFEKFYADQMHNEDY